MRQLRSLNAAVRHASKTDDRKVRNWLKLRVYNNTPEESILAKWPSIFPPYLDVARKKKLRQIEVGFPIAWRKFAKKLEAQGFRKGLIYVEKTAKKLGIRLEESLVHELEDADFPKLLPIIIEQQNYHHVLDPNFFAPIEDYDVHGYVEEIKRWAKKGELIAYGVRHGRILIAFAAAILELPQLWDRRNGTYISELIVTEGYRRRGYGKLLMDRIFDEIGNRFKRSRLAWTSLSAYNVVALRFYQKCGFKPVEHWYYLNL